MNIEILKEDLELSEIFEIAAKLGISNTKVKLLIEKLERVGLDAKIAGDTLRKILKKIKERQNDKTQQQRS